MIPLESQMIKSLHPYNNSKFAIVIPAAPAPLIVTFAYFIDRLETLHAFIAADNTTIAVPC